MVAAGVVRTIAIADEDARVEALRQQLGYPVKEKDKQDQFWYLRPGKNEEEAKETCPIAVGFLPELDQLSDQEIKQLFTTKEGQAKVYGHYVNRTAADKPVMYLLYSKTEKAGRVAMVLPDEGKLRQRQIQTFPHDSEEFRTRLRRLEQKQLERTDRIQERALLSIPLVEYAFYKPIETAKELAKELAERAREIERIIPLVFEQEAAKYVHRDQDGYLHKLFKSFQRELLPSLKQSSDNEKDYSFADIYAQTIAYSLFTARVFGYVKDRREGKEHQTHFDRVTAWQQLPETNPFLRKLFQDISERSPEELGDDLIGAIADIFSVLRAARMDAILSDFEQKMNREDIVIRFYEDFLAAYKPQMRERRGVYYTPEPVVSYMVRSVDILLKEKFNKPLGLADPEVEILEPACGTGTFLLYIFRLVHERFHNERDAIKQKVGDISWSDYVSNCLLPRVYGFELLAAPYAIAHLKLGLFLEETGYRFNTGKRLEVILTNTLDKPERKSEVLFGEYISEESDRAVIIKRDQPVMLVIGNPPYSYESQNNGDWISALIRDYYLVDGQPLGERNPKGLQDDYVKFIRFAQWKIQQTGQGLLAFINNHSYIDNPTFRGMRQSLQRDFNTICILDSHGNTKKKESTSSGTEDKNIFDVQQGVAIGFLLNLPKDNSSRKIFHSNLWGTREFKYQWYKSNDIKSTNWNSLECVSPNYFLIPQDTKLLNEYEKYWKINEIMPLNSVGLYTARDNFSIWENKEEVQRTLSRFIELSTEQARQEFNLGNDSQDWTVLSAQKDVFSVNLDSSKIQSISYRPFDSKYTFYTGKSGGLICRPRPEIMRHMIGGQNLAICFMRRSREQIVSNFLAVENLVDKTILSSADNASIAPLYIYPSSQNVEQGFFEFQRQANFSDIFLQEVVSKLGYTPTPEAIFYYIYAIFHSPTYRTRYTEFLKIDFPRVPLTRNNALFRQLATYGEELVALHLMKSPRLDTPITQFVESGGERLIAPAHPTYANGKVTLNKKGDGFVGVPEEVWKFHVGGYPVCAKWLKDRKGRTLSDEDIFHYQKIVVALQETIRLMAAIDQAIPGFPII